MAYVTAFIVPRCGPESSRFSRKCVVREVEIDPDGIRTRVAALKGPCPRPLDDGAGQSPEEYAGGARCVNDDKDEGRRQKDEKDERFRRCLSFCLHPFLPTPNCPSTRLRSCRRCSWRR